jgi:hypothetical protein
MRFMVIIKGNAESEAGIFPKPEFMAAMGKYNEELAKAGVLVDLAGLAPTSKGAKIKYWKGKRTVVDGPFAEAKEVIAGYWILKLNSLQEAIDWVQKIPFEAGGPQEGEGEVEIRQFYEMDEVPGAAE